MWSPNHAIGSILLTLVFALAGLAAVGDGRWQTKVPRHDRGRATPLDLDPNAITAGEKLFEQHCAQCHGSHAEGKNNKPSLHSERVRNATPGELQWLLKNGSLKNGMPSWSRLPEQQRWELVSFLKSLR